MRFYPWKKQGPCLAELYQHFLSCLYNSTVCSAPSRIDSMSHFPSDFTPTDFLKELLDTGGPLVLHSINPSLSSSSLNRPWTRKSWKKTYHLNPLDFHNDTPTYLWAALARLDSAQWGLGIFPQCDLLICWGSVRVDHSSHSADFQWASSLNVAVQIFVSCRKRNLKQSQ